jgi:hypothetical protein
VPAQSIPQQAVYVRCTKRLFQLALGDCISNLPDCVTFKHKSFVFLRALCGLLFLPLQVLHNHRNALAAADACRRQPVFSFAPPQFVQ